MGGGVRLVSSMKDDGKRAVDRLLSSSTRQVLLLGLVAGLSLAGYLVSSNTLFRAGFPLDDAWIHQTYARNLAESGQMAFSPGHPSAGSTSPAWTALLAIGHRLGVAELAWAYLLGWLLLWGMAVIAWAGFKQAGFSGRSWGLAAGVLIALEWHLVWAAGSGMETLLHADIILLFLFVLLWMDMAGRQDRLFAQALWPWMLVGMLAGLGVWVRPDGLTLLGLAGWVIIFGVWSVGAKLRIGMYFLAGFFALLLPYLWFNFRLSGEIWPNTFYAKQAEYAVLRSIPVWQRFLAEFRLPLVGTGVLLLPGLIISTLACLQRRNWPALGGILWLFGYLGLYALRLPATYQHGRYVMPAMPVFFLFGLAGLVIWFEATISSSRIRLFNAAWSLACCAVLLVFWVIGARAYARDVAVIESEMVATARWVSQNTEPNARLAAHDIGALGYFGGREIVDLAGLVSPEVVPIIRDERELGPFLHQEKIGYLVTFPEWYPDLIRQGIPTYTTSGSYSVEMGGENMVVYRWVSQHPGN